MKASFFPCVVAVLALAAPAPGQGTFAVGRDQSIPEEPVGVFFVNALNGEAPLLFEAPDWINFHGATDAGDERGFWAIEPYIGPELDWSRLHWIDVFARTCTQVGPDIQTNLQELAYNEGTGVLYATNYTDLYTLNPTTGIATYVGQHGPGIENVWAMDYDPSIDKLVAMGHRPVDPCDPVAYGADMYYVDPGTGAATFIADTGNRRLTDVWYDHTTEQMFALGNFPGKVMRVNTTTGQTTDYRSMVPVEMNLVGAGNPSVPIAPQPMEMSAMNHAGVEVGAEVYNMDTMEEDGASDCDFASEWNDPADIQLDALASITDAWQSVDSSSHTSFTVGSAHLQAVLQFHTEGDDGGNPSIERHGHAGVEAFLDQAELVIGEILPLKRGQPPMGQEQTVTLVITIEREITEEGEGNWMDCSLWFGIFDDPMGPPLFETSQPGTYDLEVPAGQTLMPKLDVLGWGEGRDADLFCQVDVYLTAFGDVPIPEPASLGLLALGGAVMALRQRRRKA